MKTRLVLFAVLLSALPRPVEECYTIDISVFVEAMRRSGAPVPSNYQTKWGEYKSKSLCEKALATEEKFRLVRGSASCVPCKGSRGSSANSATPMESLMKRIVDFAFKDTSAEDAAARQRDIELYQQELARQAEEAASQKKKDDAIAQEKWNELKTNESRDRALLDRKKLVESNRLLGNIGTTGGGELTLKMIGTNPFGTANPTEVKLQPKESGRYAIPSTMTTLETLQGAAYFLKSAVDAAGDYEGAAFLAEQADKMVQRQPTDIPWKLAPLPNVPAAPTPEAAAAQKQKVTVLIGTLKKEVASIQAVKIKIAELDLQIKTAERGKETARVKRQEAEAKAVAAKPEEKAQADELLRLARLVDEEANGQVAKLNEEKAARVKEEEKRNADLKDLENQIKNLVK
jgi:hypothetical protein